MGATMIRDLMGEKQGTMIRDQLGEKQRHATIFRSPMGEKLDLSPLSTVRWAKRENCHHYQRPAGQKARTVTIFRV